MCVKYSQQATYNLQYRPMHLIQKGENKRGLEEGRKQHHKEKRHLKIHPKEGIYDWAHRKSMRQNILWKGIKSSAKGSRTKWGLGSTVDPKNEQRQTSDSRVEYLGGLGKAHPSNKAFKKDQIGFFRKTQRSCQLMRANKWHFFVLFLLFPLEHKFTCMYTNTLANFTGKGAFLMHDDRKALEDTNSPQKTC